MLADACDGCACGGGAEAAIAWAKEFKRLRKSGGQAVAKLDGAWAGDSRGKSTSTKERLLSFELSSMLSAGAGVGPGGPHRNVASVDVVSTEPANGPSEPMRGRGVVGAD